MSFRCEICGATEVVKRGGVFICEGCGVGYSADDLRKLVLGGGDAPAEAGGAAPGGGGVAAPRRIGRCVRLGRHGGEDLSWRVVDEHEGRALLLCDKVVAARRYHDESQAVTWEESSLRAWLNGPFLDGAFTEDEQASMAVLNAENPDNEGYGTAGGAFTADHVFVPSLAQAKSLFAVDDERLCRPTDKAKEDGAWVNEMGYARWWLRTPGFMQNMAAYVETDGTPQQQGIFVDNAGVGVRPALWLADVGLLA